MRSEQRRSTGTANIGLENGSSHGDDMPTERVGQASPSEVEAGRGKQPLPWDGAQIAQVTVAYLAVRAVLLIANVLAAHQSYGGHLAGPVASWDSHFYLSIARSGYPAEVLRNADGSLAYSSAAFLPVFPLLIAAVAHLGVPVVGAGIIVSVLAGWVATVAVWQLGTAVGDQQLGYGSAILFMTFPGMAISWGLIYSECVGTALVAISLLLMMHGRWVTAGVAGALASATSPVALALVVPALFLAVQEMRLHRRLSWALYTAILCPVGFVGFVLSDGIRYHDLLYYWHLQHEAWGVDIDFGKGLVLLLGHLWRGGYQGPAWLEWVAVVAVLLAGWAMYKARLPGFITAYVVATILLLFLSNQGLKPRLLTWAFPALIAVAAVLKPRSRNTLALAFMGLMPMLFLAFTTLGSQMVQP
jgi:hypothetical protein